MLFQQQEIIDGIRLHALETDKFKTITMKVFIQQDLRADTAAATAILPSVLARGSQNYPSSYDLARRLEMLYGARFGADIIKIGERQIIEFYFDMVSPDYLPTGQQELCQGIQTFWDVITNPVRSEAHGGFREDYFTQEKQNMQSMVEGLINDKRAYAAKRAVEIMCADEPFGVYKYGDLDQIAALDPVTTYEYYQKLLTRYPIDIFLVGCNLEEACRVIADLGLPRERPQELKPVVKKIPQQATEVKENRDVAQAVLVMGYRTPIDYLAENYYALVMANGIFGAFPHSKLFANVREKASLAYYVGSSLEGTKGIVTVGAGVEGRQYSRVVSIIQEQLATVQRGEISSDEFEQTKKGIISGLQAMQDTPSALIDRNVIGLINNRFRTAEEIIAQVESISRDDIVAAAQSLQLDTVYFLHGEAGGELS